jgi:hypothetical protein
MNHWMFKCKEVTRMVSESLDRKLPLYQRIGVRIHLLMCKFCSRFKKQLLFLRETIRLHVERGNDTELSTKLPPEARERIRKSIQNNSFKPK